MRRSTFWSMAIAGLALGTLGMLGGTAVGGELRSMIVGYAVIVALCALYVLAGLAIRDRTLQRMSRPMPPTAQPERLAGRRVF